MKVYDVFLSYRHSDGFYLTYEIYKYLTAKGFRVFWDKEKMEDGHYFNKQIVKYLRQIPNYILVATPDVFKFREKEDWVEDEIELALEAYENDQENRTINVVVPGNFELPMILPSKIKNLDKPNRIYLSGSNINDKEKKQILDAVTYINRHNMWNAGQRWLENSRKKGSRFSNFSINEMLLPRSKCVRDRKKINLPIYTTKDNQETKPLLEHIKEMKGHLYLIGDGGIGKTTSLMKIMETAYDEQEYASNKQIPLFIELACAPDTYGKYYEHGKSTFIRRSIYQQIHNNVRIRQISQNAIDQIDDAFIMDPEISVYPINDLFTEETGAPEFLLLLDGMNEVSRVLIQETGQTVIQMIFREIKWLLQKCPNIRVIMTSRVEENFSVDTPIEYLRLQGVDDEVIREYLQKQDFAPEKIEKIFLNGVLAETLKTPLFLILFAETIADSEVSMPGEILHIYFNEKSEYIDAYTMQKHFMVVEENVKKYSEEVLAVRVDAMTQNFILDFLIPELAWFMVKKEKMYVDYEDVGEFLIKVLEEKNETSVFGRYGKRLFEKYRNKSNLKQNTYYYAKKMLNMSHNDSDELAEIILNCSVFSIAIMQEKDGMFGFVHHHIRDYFAAVKIVNDLRMAVYLKNHDFENMEMCNLSLKFDIVNDSILYFISDILGEYRNRPRYMEGWKYGVPSEPCDRNLIERNLEIYRKRYEGNSYIIKNLVDILKLGREDLAGINLSNLDLTDCDLSDVNLGYKGLNSDLSGIKVKGATILSYAHETFPQDVCYSPDGKYILTLNRDGSIKCWDVKTLKCDKILFFGEPADAFMFSPDGNTLAVNAVGKIFLWDWNNNKMISSFDSRHKKATSILNFSYSKDGKLFSTVSYDGEVRLWDTIKYSKEYKEEINPCVTITHKICYDELHVMKHNKIANMDCKSAAVLRSDGKQMVVSADNVIVLWNLETGKYFDIEPVHKGEVGAVVYHPSEKYIVFGSGGQIEIWNIVTKTYQGVLKGHDTTVNYLEFSKNGEYLISISEDKTVRLWNFKTKSNSYSWKCGGYGTKAIFSPDEDKVLILWKNDPRFDIYDAFSGIRLNEKNGRRNWSKYARYIGDGTKFVTGTFDGFIKVWDEEKKVCLRMYPHVYLQEHFACSDDGRYLFGINKTYADDPRDLYSIKMWDDEKQLLIKEIVIGEGEKECITDISYNSERGYLAIAQEKGYQIWNMKTFCKIYESYNNDISLYDNFIEFSGDGKYFITLKNDARTLVMIRTEDYQEMWCIRQKEEESIKSGIFSKSGKYIATVSWGCIRIYNVDNKKCEQIVKGHSANFSADDKYVVTALSDNMAGIWDVKSGKCTGILQESKQKNKQSYIKKESFVFDAEQERMRSCLGHTAEVLTADFSVDGRHIITASLDGLVMIWDVDTCTVVDTLYMLAGKTGVNINGVNMSNLHPDSQVSDEDRLLLKQYGVILN